MTRDVYSLPADKSVESAAWRLSLDGMSGAPVRDAKGTVIGVLSATDLIDPLCKGTTVGDKMNPCVWAVAPDAPVMDAVNLMVAKDIHRVLVLSGPGKLAGIVTTMDILRAIADGKLESPELTDCQGGEQ